MSSDITDIPVEVLLDNLLPLVDIRGLLNLGSTSHFFALLCADDMLWKRRCQADFNFSGEGTARKSGWKFIYQGLFRPRIFTWGENADARLGLSRTHPMSQKREVPFPCEVKIPRVRIVNLRAGGMSFHALDSVGDVYVWGALNREMPALNSDGFSEAGKISPRPLKLLLPAAVRSISCGRLHSSILDSNLSIWTFLSWGRPFRLASPLLDRSSPDSTPAQIECGWTFSSVLTVSGDVFVWWPFGGQLGRQVMEKYEQMDNEGDKRAYPTSDGIIPCVTWDSYRNPFRLSALPSNLPQLGEGSREDIKLVKIAALDNNIIGLTNEGHVLKHDMLVDEDHLPHGRWEYLPAFSEAQRIREHPAFSPAEDHAEIPDDVRITHISAHFRTFFAYSTGSSSIVLMGSMETTTESLPTVIPALQHSSVISVVLGDYHFGALTATGKLLTWGAYSHGALGLGDPAHLPVGSPGGFQSEQHRRQALEQMRRATPSNVEMPVEVKFDHGARKTRKTFCFAAAASGWHMGALVIDLEGPEDDDDDDDDAEPSMPGQFPTSNLPHSPTRRGRRREPFVPTVFRSGPFRVGFAGRGAGRGGGGGF